MTSHFKFLSSGKGNFWSIHPACEEDFAKGDYRRRHARRRARRSTQSLGSCPPQMYRYGGGYVPMRPMTTNFGLSYGATYGRYMPYSYGGYSPAYPTTGFSGYAPNVTVSTPGSGYVHQQHLSFLSSGDSSFNSSLASSPSQGSLSSSPDDLSFSPTSSGYIPSGVQHQPLHPYKIIILLLTVHVSIRYLQFCCSSRCRSRQYVHAHSSFHSQSRKWTLPFPVSVSF